GDTCRQREHCRARNLSCRCWLYTWRGGKSSNTPTRSFPWPGRLARSRRLVHDPAEAGAGEAGQAAQVGEPGAELVLGRARQLSERRECALDHVARVARLALEVLRLPPERPLTLVEGAEAGAAEPPRPPLARGAPTSA